MSTLSDYEDEKWIYQVVKTDTQGSPCEPFYSMQVKDGVVELAGIMSSMKAALEQLDDEQARADKDIASYEAYLSNVRTITDSEDRPGLLREEKARLLDNYRDNKSHAAFDKRRAAIHKSYESYAKQMGWKF